VHVLYASHRYYPVAGGTERAVQTLAEEVVRRGHRATVVTQREPGASDQETLNGVKVIRIPIRTIWGIRFPSHYLRTLRGIPADLFHLTGNRIWCADFYFPHARGFRWPQVLTGHGFYQYAVRPRWRDRVYFERYFPWAVRAFDRYLCDTEFERQQLIGWGVSPGRLVRLPLGVPVEELRRGRTPVAEVRAGWGLPSPFVGVYGGGFFENKRVDRLLEAVALRGGRWGLVLLGPDVPGSPYSKDRILARARELGVPALAPGAVPREAAVDALNAGDAVVTASEYEGFGLLYAEALALGRPLVAWAAGAAPEIVATGAGFAVHSVHEFAQALERLEDSTFRHSVADRARAAASEWSIERYADRHLALYQSVLDERRGA
jgi:glycosyltransferase involved in cell wall biosynthesis